MGDFVQYLLGRLQRGEADAWPEAWANKTLDAITQELSKDSYLVFTGRAWALLVLDIGLHMQMKPEPEIEQVRKGRMGWMNGIQVCSDSCLEGHPQIATTDSVTSRLGVWDGEKGQFYALPIHTEVLVKAGEYHDIYAGDGIATAQVDLSEGVKPQELMERPVDPKVSASYVTREEIERLLVNAGFMPTLAGEDARGEGIYEFEERYFRAAYALMDRALNNARNPNVD